MTSSDTPGSTTQAVPSLKPEHIAYLAQRAVPLEIALAAGLYSAARDEVAQLLGLPTMLVQDGGTVIPYQNIEPKFARVRMDGEGPRFLAPPGRGAPIYVPPVEAARDVGGPMLVVEGPVKALAAVAHGFRCVGLGGAETGLTRDRKLDPSWAAVEVPDRGIVLLPDADVLSNYRVMRGQARLALALSDECDVKIARLPGPGKMGPDDFLAREGSQALQAIVARAVPTRPSERVKHFESLDKATCKSEVAALLEDLFFLVAVLEWGEAERFRVREAFRLGGGAGALDAALGKAQSELRKTSHHDSGALDTGPYRQIGGKFCRVYVTPEGFEKVEALSNFTAEITKECSLDDGVDPQLVFEIKGTRSDGVELGVVEVTAQEYTSRAWPVDKWGARAVVLGTAGAMAHTRAAIQLFSRSTERIKAYTHTGFREIDGKLVYLHAGGAVGGENVTMHLDASLARYRLPEASVDLRSAVLLSLRMLDVAPDEVSVPLFCATYLAPLCHWLPVAFVLWVWGKTGSFKTAITTIAQAHFGNFDAVHLPGSWLSTMASLEHLLSRAKDALGTIDDFVPKSTHELDEMRRKGAQLVRSVGNNMSRGRMRQDLTARPDRPPRGMVAVTGEDVLHGESSSARTFAVRVEKSQVNLDVLSQLQLHVHQLPAAMRGYIEYLISQDARLKACIEQRVIQLRADFTRKGQHARAPDAAARLALGAEVFSHFAIHVGVFDKTGAQRLRERVHAALVKASAAHGDTEQQRRPVVRFLSVLGSLLAQHKVVLGDDPKALPENVTTAGEVFGGWRDGARVLLLPEAVFGAVTSALRASNEQFPISSDTLWTEFKDLGYLAAHEQGRVRIKRHVGAGRTRVLEVWATVLDGPDGTTPGDPTEPPDSGSAAPAAPPPPRRGQTLGADLTSTHASASPGAAPIAPPADEKVVCMLPPPALAAVASAAVRGDSFFASDRGALGAVGEFAGGTNELGPPRSVDPSGVVPGPRRQGPAFAVVTDARELAAVAAAVALAESVALDTETTGLDPLKDRVRLVQLGLPDGSIYVIDTWATVGLGAVAEVLGQVRWLGHNLSFDVGFMRQLAVAPTKVVDTMLLAQVLDCGLNTGVKGYFKLSALLQRHLGIQIPKDEQTSDWSAALQPEQLDYAARDVQHVHALVEALARQLEKLALAPTAALECDLLPALVDLRLSGVYFDRDRWAALNEQRRRDAAEAKAFVERELGIANAASATKQLLPALQRRLGAGVTATNAEALAPYASDPVVQALERFRVATAFVKNHGDPLLATMGKHGDGRVRSDWIQIAAPTGRMACRNPPLLNLPKAQEVRSCVVGPPGHVLVVADFAQIELLVAAQYLKVARLLEVYGNGGDVHRMMAALVAGIPESEVTKEQRRGAKPVNFGFLFGMGPATFVKKAREYEVSYTIDEARRFQGAYLRAYPEVARWHRQIGNSMPAEMRTMGGRVRAFPDRRTGYTERLNMPIQGTAADGFKAAIAILYPRLAALGARIVLAVHDELVVEAPEARAEEVKVCVEAGMIEGMSRFVSEVPIVVEAHIVSSWAEAK